jgi:hypothetical protein
MSTAITSLRNRSAASTMGFLVNWYSRHGFFIAAANVWSIYSNNPDLDDLLKSLQTFDATKGKPRPPAMTSAPANATVPPPAFKE